MNSLIRLTGDFQTARGSQPGSATLPTKGVVAAEKIARIRKSLETVLSEWPKDAIVEDILVSVEYRQIVAKSNRIREMLNGGKEHEPEASICGARYLDFNGDRPRHLMTHYVPEATIRSTIDKLRECERIAVNHFDGLMNADKMVDLVKNDRLKQKWNTAISCTLTRSVYAQLIRDCYYVSEFRIEKPPTAKDEDAIVTLFKTERDPQDLFKELGIDVSPANFLENSVLLTETEYRKLLELAPYLVAMSVIDLSSYTPMNDNGSASPAISSLPECPANEPIIGVIDTPFEENYPPYFSNWVDYRSCLPEGINPTPSDYRHGTCVSSLIVDVQAQNPALDDHCGHFRVRHFGVATAGKFSSFAVMKHIERIVAENQDIKVWNISLGSREEVARDSISPEAALLDKLQQKYDVLFVVAGTNQENGEPRYLGSPADSINAIVVNAVNGNNEPASYTRRGPVLSFHHKPDLAYYGGENNDPITACCGTGAYPAVGTSFAAPLIARKAAYLIYKMHLSCELAKALLIDAACAWTAPEDMDRLGYGIVPIQIERILETSNDEIRFMLSGVATERENYNFNFPIPVSGTSYPSVARATLCYFPKCNRNQGVDYTDTELDLHFGRIRNDGRIKSLLPNNQGEEDCTTDEEKARKKLRKWDNVKHIAEPLTSRSKPKKVYANPMWGMMIRKSSRYQSGSHEPQRFGVVVTIHNLKGENRIDAFIRQCSAIGWIVERVEIDNELRIYEHSQVEVEFE